MRNLIPFTLATLSFAATCALISGCHTAPRPTGDGEPLDADEATLQAFENTPEEDVAATYEAHSIPQRAAMWRAQMKRSLARPDLDDAQRAIITDFALHAEEYLAGGLPDAAVEPIEAAFDVKQKASIFEHLGVFRPAPKPTIPADKAGQAFAMEPCETRWCACCDCCLPPCGTPEVQGYYTCGGTCSSTSSGCGALWLQSCTKLCIWHEPAPN